MEEQKMKIFFSGGLCPVRDVLGRLGDKWTALVLISLKANGTLRFSALQRSIGDISQRMLTVTLRSLEADGLIKRKVYAEVPPKVEYELTERGLSLYPHLEALVEWSREHMSAILADREKRLD
ncbi:MAG: transcriptional regulator [Bacteroidia bacterium]|nr:transcriptional regulator [Bacteroidia bacterium]